MEQAARTIDQQAAEHSLQQFAAQIQAAGTARQALCIKGGGSKDWYGQNLEGAVLDTRAYRGIVDYDPTELVITARCGTPLAEIEAVLAAQQQMLAFEPPAFGPSCTAGGMVASGLSGPRRATVGAVRDFMLGAVLMDGKGDILRFGGQVMKNVAGYDVSRLLVGSLGTLGLLLEVSLKVLPKPLHETSLRFAMDEEEAITRLNQWGGQPLPISASAWHDGFLTLRLSGAHAATAAARQKLGGQEIPDGATFWQALREQQHDYFQDAPSLWRLSLPSITAPLKLDGAQLFEWGGAQRWLKTAMSAQDIRRIATQAGGHATLFRGGDKRDGVFQALAPAIAQIHQRLKASFDPSGIFNRARLYPDW